MNLPNLTATKDFIRDKCIRGCDTYEQLNMCSEMIDDYITGRFKRYAPPMELLAAIRELENEINEQRCKIVAGVYSENSILETKN
jgi:hypothetical protein